MNNSQIADIFEDIAGLLQMKGESVFTTRAYQRVARTIDRLPFELEQMVREERDLKEIPGIGTAIAEKITELTTSGKLGYYDKLCAEFPEGILEVMRVPRVGPKTTKRLLDELGVSTVPELEAAITDGAVAGLPRMGKKLADNILREIQSARVKDDRVPIARAMPASERVIAAILERCPTISRLEAARGGGQPAAIRGDDRRHRPGMRHR